MVNQQSPTSVLHDCAATDGCVGGLVRISLEGPVAVDDELLNGLIPMRLESLEVSLQPRPHGCLPDHDRFLRRQEHNVVSQHVEQCVEIV
jgi:hypothetical protein